MSDLRLSKKEAARVQRLLMQPRPCLLCQGFPATVPGLFVPDHPELWGGKSGKRRVLGDALCSRCFALPDKLLHVEARIMRDLAGHTN